MKIVLEPIAESELYIAFEARDCIQHLLIHVSKRESASDRINPEYKIKIICMMNETERN